MRLRCFALGVLLCAAPGAAEVKLKVGPDGSLVLYNEGRRPVRPSTPPGRRLEPADLGELIDSQAGRWRLDPELVRAVIEVESGYRPEAVSSKGAMGLMQLMPDTARDFSVQDPFDPHQNVAAGTAYLRRVLDIFDGRLELALAGYNAGPEAVKQYGGVPPFGETRNYVERVMRIYRREPGYSLAASGSLRMGRRTYLSRDRNGRLLLTTSPPAAH